MQGDIFIGAGGANSSAPTIFDGQHASGVAFCHNYFPNVQLQNMCIQHYMASNDSNNNDYEVYAGTNWILTNVCINWGGCDGVSLSGGCQMNGGEVKSCRHRGIGFLGNNVIVNGVEIANNNTENSNVNDDAAGLKGGACSGIVVEYCYVHNNNAVGLWADEGCSGWYIIDNDVQNNSASGIMYEISTGGSIYNNLVSNNGGSSGGRGQIVVSSSQNTNVYLNTVTAGPTQGAIYLQSDGVRTHPMTLQNCGISRNNVTFTASGFYGLVVYNGSGYLGTGNYSNGNNFHVNPGVGTSEFLWNATISTATTDFPTYQASSGQDPSSTIAQY